jgi:hypothetical protein
MPRCRPAAPMPGLSMPSVRPSSHFDADRCCGFCPAMRLSISAASSSRRCASCTRYRCAPRRTPRTSLRFADISRQRAACALRCVGSLVIGRPFSRRDARDDVRAASVSATGAASHPVPLDMNRAMAGITSSNTSAVSNPAAYRAFTRVKHVGVVGWSRLQLACRARPLPVCLRRVNLLLTVVRYS